MLALMQTTRPDDATGDGAKSPETIARVHSFLCALLSFLGFRVLPVETVVDMLDTLETWLVDAKKVRDDRKGVTSKLWWDAFKEAWKVKDTIGAGVAADSAINEFGKRFVPIVSEDENDRDTDTGDLDAMRTELDAADRYRNEICDALDGIESNRAFVHGKVIDELRAERDALLKTNAHHANEVERLRGQFVALDKTHKAFHVSHNDFLRAIVRACGKDPMHSEGVDVIGLVSDLKQERDALKAQLTGAIVPLPKPDRIAKGQLWCVKFEVLEMNGALCYTAIGTQDALGMETMDGFSYLGTETA